MERSWIFIALAVRYDKCLKLWAHAWFLQSWSADCGRGDPGKAAWQKFSTVWSTNYYRQEHVIFFDGLFGFFFYFMFPLYERESLCFSCFALILSLPDWCTWNKNINCTVFSQTHAECIKMRVNHFLNHKQWPFVIFRGGQRKQLWEEIFFSAGTGRERSEKTQTHLQNSHHRSACGLRYLVVLFTSNHSWLPSSQLSEHLICL